MRVAAYLRGLYTRLQPQEEDYVWVGWACRHTPFPRPRELSDVVEQPSSAG